MEYESVYCKVTSLRRSGNLNSSHFMTDNTKEKEGTVTECNVKINLSGIHSTGNRMSL
jgi:hypothetical protein